MLILFNPIRRWTENILFTGSTVEAAVLVTFYSYGGLLLSAILILQTYSWAVHITSENLHTCMNTNHFEKAVVNQYRKIKIFIWAITQEKLELKRIRLKVSYSIKGCQNDRMKLIEK
jgi:hypothetical protein